MTSTTRWGSPAPSVTARCTAISTPELAAALVEVVARCAPELLVDVYAQELTSAGAPPDTALCVARRIVGDAALLDLVIAATASGSATAPPELRDVAAACS